MENKTIHIVSLDVPFPPDYGGMMDVFYRIKSLKELGFDIILHCFTYGRGEPKELLQYCSEVHFYKRKKSLISFFSKKPFIVETRKSTTLLKRLQADEYSILLEGIHSCWYLEELSSSNRVILVRTHNVEHDYYQGLGDAVKGFKRIFFHSEAKKLKCYEPILAQATALLTIQESDLAHFQKINANSYLLRASFPDLEMNSAVELGDYCLFHGNLSVAEVHDSAMWLLKEVIPFLRNISFKVAGKNPNSELVEAAKQANVELIINPNTFEMNQLIVKSKIHVLPTTQETGIKLKLLMALQCLGKTIVNDKQLAGNDLAEYCIVANSPQEFISAIEAEYEKEVDVIDRETSIQSFKAKMNSKEQIRNVFHKIGII